LTPYCRQSMVCLLVIKETWKSSHYPYQKCSHIFLITFHKSLTHKIRYEIMNYFLNNFKAHNGMGDTWTLIWPNFMVHKINFIVLIFSKTWTDLSDPHMLMYLYLSTAKQQTVHQAIHWQFSVILLCKFIMEQWINKKQKL
jgi:hypothetical protein